MGKTSNYEKRPRDYKGSKNPAYKHGANQRGKRTTEYEIWAGIRARVNTPSNKLFPYYGGRGIGYDPKWESFEGFLEDVGPRPSKLHSLDRIDNEKSYSKENCRWATRKEQSCNRRNNIFVEGVVLKDWCVSRGFNYKTVWRWITKEKITLQDVINRGHILWVNT